MTQSRRGSAILEKKVLVTGAGGFIGSHLVELLVRRGFGVRAFVHYNSANHWYNLEKASREVLDAIEIVAGDVTDAFAVDKAVAGCDLVFHLAALIGIPYSYVAPAAYVATNVIGTLNVLEACRRHGIERMVHTSTSETYGTAQYVPMDEGHPLVGQSPYSASKIAADKLAESFWLSFETPVTILRPFNTYGPRQSMRAVIPTIVVQSLLQDELMLGSLEPIRDFTFVEDTARGFLAAADSEKVIGEVVNLGVGKGVSIAELIDRIGRTLGRTLMVRQENARIRPERSEVTRLISDNTKALNKMDWRPMVDLDAGLAAVVAYIKRHLDEFKHGIYAI